MLTKSDYRLDIQGLRAISVLLVFFSHANWYPFTGGFVGVDIFFVISGYVITQLLLKEFNINHNIILHKFYARRLQRLMPVLITVILFTSIVSLILLTPMEQVLHYDSGMSAVMWLSNIYFPNYDINYFTSIANSQMYLHTWSLGVEEQFYLMWPILMLIGFKYFYYKNKKPFTMTLYLIVIILSSVLILAYFTSITSNLAFYLMPSRAWQFGLGGMVALFHFNSHDNSHKCVTQKDSFLYEFLAIIGMVMIVFSALMFEIYTPYPNWQVFIPSIGVTFILFSKPKNGYSSVGKILALRPLVFLGDISYSFYLWHWPILLLCKKLVMYFPLLNTIFALCLTLLMTLLTYYFIEQPIRKNKKLRINYKFTIILFVGIMAVTIFTLMALKLVSEKFEGDKEQQYYKMARNKLPITYDLGCDDWYHSSKVVKCEFGNKTSEKKVVLFGDSTLIQWFPAILDYYESLKWHVIVYSKNGCPIINRPFFYYRILAVYSVCDDWRSSTIDEIVKLKPDVIIMGNSIGYPFKQNDWVDGTKEVIDQLLPITKNIKLIAGTPELNFDPSICLSKKSWLSKFFSSVTKAKCSQEFIPSEVWQWQQVLASSYQNVEFIELSKHVCSQKECKSLIDGMMIYRDRIHLTVDFVMQQKDIVARYLSSNK